MGERKSLSTLDLPQTVEEWADYTRDLLLELKTLCKDPIHVEHLAVVEVQIALNASSAGGSMEP